jgi:hypothetical protein
MDTKMSSPTVMSQYSSTSQELTEFAFSIRVLRHVGSQSQHAEPTRQEDSGSNQNLVSVLGTEYPPKEYRGKQDILLLAS